MLISTRNRNANKAKIKLSLFYFINKLAKRKMQTTFNAIFHAAATLADM